MGIAALHAILRSRSGVIAKWMDTLRQAKSDAAKNATAQIWL